MAKQTCLEKNAIEKRQEELVRSDYNILDQYFETHPDAISNGDPQGKGSGYGGHTHYVPDCERPKTEYFYNEIDTRSPNIGGQYDIEGRNGVGGRDFLKAISVYNEENQYGLNSIDTTANILDGQIIIR